MNVFKTLSLIIVIGFITACSKEIERNCTSQKIEAYDLIAYNGEELDPCDFILELYTLNGNQYFQYYQPCTYNMVYPRDCDGNLICGSEDTMSCIIFFDAASYEGIIGFRKPY